MNDVLSMAMCAYSDAVKQYKVMSELLDTASNNPSAYDTAAYQKNADSLLTASADYYMGVTPEELLSYALESGDYVSWDKEHEKLDSGSYERLVQLTPERREDYAPLVAILTKIVGNRGHETEDKSLVKNEEYYKQYTARLRDLLTYDAEISNRLIDETYYPFRKEDSFEYESYLYYRGINVHPDIVGDRSITYNVTLDELFAADEVIVTASSHCCTIANELDGVPVGGRDPETLEYLSLPGIYPCGEGAGYSGGIVSSALDGINVAVAVAASLK